MKFCKLFLLLIIVYVPQVCFGQNIIAKIKLHVIPLSMSFKKAVKYSEVKKLSQMTLIYNESCNKVTFDDIFNKLNKDSLIKVDKVNDFRILLIMKKKILGNERIYFNEFGDFFYNGGYYKNNGLFDLIFPYIIECAKKEN